MIDAKLIKDNINDDIIINILKSLGSNDPLIISNGYLFTTVCHNSIDGKHKLHYHKDTQMFYCYTNCGHIGDIFNLVQHTLNCTFSEAFKYVRDFVLITSSKYNLKVDYNFIHRFNETFTKYDYKIFDDNILKLYYNNIFHESWINDYISIETMIKHNIRFDIENYRIIIPIYNDENNLCGIKVRNLNDTDIVNGKYGLLTKDGITYNYKTSSILYGLNFHKKYIKKYRTVIIGESEKFVMQHGTFYDDSVAVALSGSYISMMQINLLLKYNVLNVVLALDKEFENKNQELEYAQKIQKNIINKLKPYFNISIIWDSYNLLDYKMSPTDKSKEIFEKLYNQRIII